MKDKKQAREKFISLRLSSEMRTALLAAAEKNTRTISAQVVHYIKEGLTNEASK
jgi:hypothetical protein